MSTISLYEKKRMIDFLFFLSLAFIFYQDFNTDNKLTSVH